MNMNHFVGSVSIINNRSGRMKDYIGFEPSVKPLSEGSVEDLYYIFIGEDLIIRNNDDRMRIPRLRDIAGIDMSLINKQYMGRYKGTNCYSAELEHYNEAQGLERISLMEYSRNIDEEAYLLASKAKLLLDWYKRNQYCGKCGSKMEPKDSTYERSMVCSSCSTATWPRTSPAVLVAVTKDDKILLANNKNNPEDTYSVLAGFVEYGETFEDCVRREVYEEVSIEVENIRYFGSKPWPFPNSMMIAYTADYKAGEIEVDKSELNHADWYSLEDLPRLFYNKNSIAHDLIENFRSSYRK